MLGVLRTRGAAWTLTHTHTQLGCVSTHLTPRRRLGGGEAVAEALGVELELGRSFLHNPTSFDARVDNFLLAAAGDDLGGHQRTLRTWTRWQQGIWASPRTCS